mmetsp:Transcript_12218/g.1833  ORF Transcript_12218/g.1833 Transcript_12218/m.1833 type:complete len:80 (+) Transcript_12218:746-985(+)|eukprot:CAMPEP_0168316994 /NCGR_PEP_ID=MMETSP0210-20121227/21570_1 /TAXON_ID=40633 /ORGANISM="Condylostoma magnum, Strain COL2" /LENGTH=79 /DNA_ID=CAMNT_0008309253 /DNA_START=566 /DNA_END=805 /DNA_ORIENTATION=-
MTYHSCLFDESLDLALEDAFECKKKRQEQEAERIALENASYKDSNKGDLEEEEKVWEVIEEKPYKTQAVKHGLCMDLLG